MTALWELTDAASPLSLDVPRRPSSLLWCAPFLTHPRYGDEARAFIRSLSALGWHIAARSADNELRPPAVPRGASGAVRGIEAMPGDELGAPLTAVLHVPGGAASRIPGADRTIVRTAYGAEGLPPAWVERLNQVDEVWVASSFNARTFRDAGVEVPVHVVPGGVDTDLFRPDVDPVEIPGVRGTVFLSTFDGQRRTAPDVLLRAWADAFSPTDPVTLVLEPSSRIGAHGDARTIVDALVEEELYRLGTVRSRLAPIVVLGEVLAPRHTPKVLAAADVFLGVSRGEGWGSRLLEAMASGLPTIATRWGGPLDFMTDLNSLLVDVKDVVEGAEGDGAAPRTASARRWAEPSRSHLVALMQRAAADSTMRAALGRRARMDVTRRWRWRRAAAIADGRLCEVARSVRAQSVRDEGGWCSLRLCPAPGSAEDALQR